MFTIEEAISKAYYDDEDGFGSMNGTLTEAERYNEKVSPEDVRNWLAKNIGTKRKWKGYYSFVVDQAYVEYQADLLLFQDLDKESGQKTTLSPPNGRYFQQVLRGGARQNQATRRCP